MEDKVTERALTNQTKTTKRNLPREMLTAPNYKIKCETKMDCVKQCREWSAQQTNIFLAICCLCCCFLIVSVSCCSPAIFRIGSLLVAKVFFHHSFSFFFNILFAAYYLAFFRYTRTMLFSVLFASFSLSTDSLEICLCGAAVWFGCCVRLIIFDSSGQSEKKKKNIYEKCSQHIAIEVQSK